MTTLLDDPRKIPYRSVGKSEKAIETKYLTKGDRITAFGLRSGLVETRRWQEDSPTYATLFYHDGKYCVRIVSIRRDWTTMDYRVGTAREKFDRFGGHVV